jgi:hypothetical protein
LRARSWLASPDFATLNLGYFAHDADDHMCIVPTRRSVLALIGSLMPLAAFAAHPDCPIKLVVALAPDGPADTAARV